ncbi:DMT family transporter [Salinicoccus halodurans]|uniref:Multidrug resistance protein SMR n=1 Tax=Salinicoccus halodurans TaxID=407035 RepID=A0ABN4G314_9STAP|nr:multidrug efflux SMR transporter [Salinicoccus halodurans]AKG72926.1 multidrug resistance protein SMR [Salinicoccus halodurans]
MNIQWIKVIIASIFEVGWVVGLTHADAWHEWFFTLIAIYVSFYLMINAGKYLPVGTVYAVFVGLGAFGTVLSEIVLFGEPFMPLKVVLITLILIGVIGLKMVTDDNEREVQ